MKTLKLAAVTAAVAALGGCGLENYLSNVAHTAYERPASRIEGALLGNTAWTNPPADGFSALDGEGAEITPFQRSAKTGSYEIRLPSAKYSMIRVKARAGDFLLRAIVPSIGEETTLPVDLSPETVTEALVMEARISALGTTFKQLTPAGYLGARDAIRAQFTVNGPTKALLEMVARFMEHGLPTSAQSDPSFFLVPVLTYAYGTGDGATTDFPFTFKPTATNIAVYVDGVLQAAGYTVVAAAPGVPGGHVHFAAAPAGGAAIVIRYMESPIDPNYLARNPFDYSGDGADDLDSTKFDAKLAEVAALYLPQGCPSTKQKRLVFTVDFTAGGQDGNCAVVNRFLWAKDKPGKSMFFVGWIHKDSPVTATDRPDINTMLGASSPNQIRMYDDGTNGDELAGDNIWTVAFDVDVDPDKVLRIGYKYTWGTRGAPWTGSEEWPGNSRIIEVKDVNGDGFVYRHDVFQDEATNKDKSNLNSNGHGTITWDTELHGASCGPEAHERPFPLKDDGTPVSPGIACQCGTEWFVPRALGALTEAAPIAVPQACPTP